MQFEITDEAAITFAEELYAAIADGYSIDAALGEARRAIFASGNDVEWATPVLYSRSANGQLFRLTKLSEAARLTEEQAQQEEAARLTQEQAQQEEAARLTQEQAQQEEVARAATERAERVRGEPADASPGDREFGNVPVEPASTPDAAVTPVPPATPSWLRRHARLTIVAVLIAIIAGGVVVAMTVGRGEDSDPQYQALLKRLPASIQPSCYNGRNRSGQNWMIEDNSALAQGTCKEEPYYLTYGLWSSASGAQTYAADAQTLAANAGSDGVPCAPNTINAMKTILPRATRACWDKTGGDDPGIIIVWNEDGSPVAAHYWWGTHDQGEALSHWKTVVQAP
jgi:hypothetical protein